MKSSLRIKFEFILYNKITQFGLIIIKLKNFSLQLGQILLFLYNKDVISRVGPIVCFRYAIKTKNMVTWYSYGTYFLELTLPT